MLMPSEFLEISTWVGRCPVNCIRYCPQEQNVARYKGKKVMSLGDFAKLTETVPSNVTYSWAGVTEPFVNRATIDMMELVAKRGNPQVLFTTGTNLLVKDARRVAAIPFEYLILHRPDNCGIANIPVTPEYEQVIGILIASKNTEQVEVMNMGKYFVTDGNERLFRPGNESIKKRAGKVTCASLRGPQYSLLPDGNLYFCCVTKGLANVVGSLWENSYPDLVKKHKQYADNLAADPDSICHKCTRARNSLLYRIANHPVFGFRDYVNAGRF